MIFMEENPLRGPLEGVGPENLDFSRPKWHKRPFRGPRKGWAMKIETFLGSEMATSEKVPFGPKFSGPTPSSDGPNNGFTPIKIINSKRQIKK